MQYGCGQCPTFYAGVPERSKGSDCNSDAKASVVRIHPPAPNFYIWYYCWSVELFEDIGLNSVKVSLSMIIFIDNNWVGWFCSTRNRFGTSRRANFAA